MQKNQPFMDLNAGEKGTLMVGLANGLGGMQWELVGTLFLSWVVVYLIIWKGLHSSGKVAIETFVKLWLSNTQKSLSIITWQISNCNMLLLFFRSSGLPLFSRIL